MRKYINRIKSSDNHTKNRHALLWATLFTIIFVVIYFRNGIIKIYNAEHIFSPIVIDVKSSNFATGTEEIIDSIKKIKELYNTTVNTDGNTINVATNTDKQIDSIYDYDSKLIQLGNEKYNLYIADNTIKRTLGLSGTKSLCEKCGLLFIFQTEDRLGFWMKDMLFAIDIIYLDKDGNITDIIQNVSPETYPKTFYSSKLAKYVIEINQGDSKILGLKKGMKVYIK